MNNIKNKSSLYASWSNFKHLYKLLQLDIH